MALKKKPVVKCKMTTVYFYQDQPEYDGPHCVCVDGRVYEQLGFHTSDGQGFQEDEDILNVFRTVDKTVAPWDDEDGGH